MCIDWKTSSIGIHCNSAYSQNIPIQVDCWQDVRQSKIPRRATIVCPQYNIEIVWTFSSHVTITDEGMSTDASVRVMRPLTALWRMRLATTETVDIPETVDELATDVRVAGVRCCGLQLFSMSSLVPSILLTPGAADESDWFSAFVDERRAKDTRPRMKNSVTAIVKMSHLDQQLDSGSRMVSGWVDRVNVENLPAKYIVYLCHVRCITTPPKRCALR